MAYWWVNHKQTRDHEVGGGYLWSPVRNANGARNQSYDNMRLARRGDIVFSYAHGRLGAIGVVTAEACASPKPHEFDSVGGYWSNEGWLVEVDFFEVPRKIRPRDCIDAIAHLLPDRYSPIQANGNGNQGIYLAAVSDALGMVLMALLEVEQVQGKRADYVVERAPDPELLDDIHDVESDATIPDTQRVQLSRARVGQGLFRKRVILLGGECLVTGVSDERVLIASHIKPWRLASNAERLDGYNGVLLSPHVDALFDQHLITFENDGHMHVHPSLPRDVLERWDIRAELKVDRFRERQHVFLEHHRAAFAARR